MGICGMFDMTGAGRVREKAGLINGMLRKMTHRGPDDEGIYVSPDGNCALAQRRLAVIDISTGHQPISNETNDAWIVFNGEIYNYAELWKKTEKLGHKFKTSCDTEVILHLYESFKSSFPAELNGMFAVAIYDEKEKKLVLSRDRMGVKPLHTAEKDGILYFASEIKALLAACPELKTLSNQAVYDYLIYGYVMAPNSIYADVKKVVPAAIQTYDAAGARTESSFWQVKCAPEYGRPLKSFSDELLSLLMNATKIRMNADFDVGAFLSSGIDSATVVALMSKISSSRIKTFTIAFDEEDHSELRGASKISEMFDCEHYPFNVRAREIELLPKLVWHFDEPFANPTSLPFFQLAQVSAQHAKAVITGDGADELFGGHERYLWEVIAEQYTRVPKFLRKNFIEKALKMLPGSTNNFFEDEIRKLKKFFEYSDYDPNYRYLSFSSYFFGETLRAVAPDFDKYEDYAVRMEKNYECAFSDDYFESWLSKVLFCDFKFYMQNDLLVKLDRMSMANSQEIRNPYLDHRIVELAMKMPLKHKIKGLTPKHVLKNMMRDTLPLSVLHKPRSVFVPPINRWFRNELKELLVRTLLGPSSFVKTAFSVPFIKKMIDHNSDGTQNYSYQLWNLFVFEIWHKVFMEGRDESLTFTSILS